MDNEEFAYKIRDWAWDQVRTLAEKDLHDYISYWDLKDAIDATQDFLVHVCRIKGSEIFLPDDIHKKLIAIDEEEEKNLEEQ